MEAEGRREKRTQALGCQSQGGKSGLVQIPANIVHELLGKRVECGHHFERSLSDGISGLGKKWMMWKEKAIIPTFRGERRVITPPVWKNLLPLAPVS
jgi:hypothetical protein